MAHDITPEERLLKLIRQKEKQPVSASAAQQGQPVKAAPAHGKFAPFNLEPIFNILSGIFEVLTLARIRAILLVVISIFFIYALVQLFMPQPNLNIDKIKESSVQGTQDKDSTIVTASKPYSYYSQKIESRDIFNAPFLANTATSVNTGVTADERIANLSLVGIVLDAKPQAIIEDKKENKTYFLNKGDQLGEFIIEDIQESKVVLSLGEEKFEMVP